MKVVFDTNVLISATLWNNSVSQKLLFRLINQEIPIYCSLEIVNLNIPRSYLRDKSHERYASRFIHYL